MIVPALTLRTREVLTGLVAIVLSASSVTVGIKIANGALRDTYPVSGTFTAAGQGLLRGSDVKIRGVNVGEVRHIQLENGQPRITLAIDSARRIPASASAVIRPKTLFGEKFVDIDPGPTEQTGPYLEPGGEITDTQGGFELQRVLDELFPVLKAVNPTELFTVIDTLAEGGRGLGGSLNTSLRNLTELADLQARHDADTRQILGDYADLSETLADSADDLVGTARDLNAVLPELNQRGPQLETLLTQAARLSGDVADVLDANREFLRNNVILGGRTLEVLAGREPKIAPLVTGLRQFLQTLAEGIRIPLSDGTRLAAVKFVVGGGNPLGQTPSAMASGSSPDTGVPRSGAGEDPGDDVGLPTGADAIWKLLEAVIG